MIMKKQLKKHKELECIFFNKHLEKNMGKLLERY